MEKQIINTELNIDKSKKIVIGITGYSGFIGSELLNTILKLKEFKNYEIVLFGRTAANVNKYVKLVYLDLESPVFEYKIKIDILVHLAAQTPNKTNFLLNQVNAENIEILIKNTKPNNVIFTSTTDVYIQKYNNILYETSLLSPVTKYGYSKLLGEINLKDLAIKYNFSLTILRLSTIYGIVDPYKRIINKFIRSGLKEEGLFVHGTGKQTRDFLYITDVVDAIIKVIENPQEGIYNVGFGKSTSINELAEKVKHIIKNVYNKKCNIAHDYSINDIKSFISINLNTNKFTRTFNFKPKITLQSGILNIVDYEYEKTNHV